MPIGGHAYSLADDHPQYLAPSKQRVFGYSLFGTVERYDDVANSWTKKNASPQSTYQSSTALNGYGYIFTNVNSKYDFSTDSWTTKTAFTTGRSGAACFSLNGYGYGAGGDTGAVSNVTEKYDDVANSWTTKATLNTARKVLGGFSLNGFGYATGGDNGAGSILSTNEKYDDVANSWTAKTSMGANNRQGHLSCSLNGFGYAAQGNIQYGAVFTNSSERYDDVANSWTTKAVCNNSKQFVGSFSLNNYNYAFGGNNGPATSTNERYDDVANTWTAKASLNNTHTNDGGFAVGYLTESYYTRTIGYTQIGSVSSAYSSTVVLFPVAFPSVPNVFVINTTSTHPLGVTTRSAGSFTFSASSAVTFNWLAITKYKDV